MKTKHTFKLLSSAIPWLAVFLGAATAVRAATVSSTADDGSGTLRKLVSQALTGDEIDFNLPIGSVITLTSGEIILNKNLTIAGPGAKNLTIQAASLNQRAFEVEKDNGGAGVTVTISRLRFTGGFSFPDGQPGTAAGRPGQDVVLPAEGGFFLNDKDCTLIVTNCFFDGCYAAGGRGGLGYGGDLAQPGKGGKGGPALGGAIATLGSLVLSGCTFSGNTANGGRGGDGTNASSSFNGSNGGDGGLAHGGAIFVDYNGAPALLATNCTLFENVAYGGDGGTGGNALLGPQAGNGGGGGEAKGGGLFYFINMCAQMDCGTTEHSTFSQNYTRPGTGGSGGSGPVNGSPGPDGTGAGGGMFLGTPDYQVGNTLLAANGGLGASLCPGPDINGTIISLGYNLVGINDGQPVGLTPLDLQGNPGNPLDPRLGPLQDNGGETLTMAPLAGSPAIDSGSAGNALFDQIGQIRPVPVTSGPFPGDGSDIGAFEVQCSYDIPALNILSAGPSLVLTWPWPSTCFVLQQSSDLLTWTDSTYAVAHVGNENQVTLSPPPPNNLFFRLKK